jgi:D-alanine-D-alanine ligase
VNVVLLYGGKSGEHEISLLSASAILRNIDRPRHRVTLIGINKGGLWFLQDPSEAERVRNDPEAVLRISEDEGVAVVPGRGLALASSGTKIQADIVFPALHGTFGEDGTVQGLLDCAGLPYVGSGVGASAVSMDKERTKQVWQNAGLPVVPWRCLRSPGPDRDALDGCEGAFGYPLFVKPSAGGSSVGAAKAGDRAALEAAVAEAFLWDEKVLVEPAIPAREIECSVTGNPFCPPGSPPEHTVRAYCLGEINPAHEFYDSDAKYIDPEGASTVTPARLTPEQACFIEDTAKRAYAALDCAGLARVDFFINKKTGAVFLNEINTMPGFTAISMFPKMCAAWGMDFPSVIELLLEEGLARFKHVNRKKTDYRF